MNSFASPTSLDSFSQFPLQQDYSAQVKYLTLPKMQKSTTKNYQKSKHSKLQMTT
jgi:hypothetical protein